MGNARRHMLETMPCCYRFFTDRLLRDQLWPLVQRSGMALGGMAWQSPAYTVGWTGVLCTQCSLKCRPQSILMVCTAYDKQYAMRCTLRAVRRTRYKRHAPKPESRGQTCCPGGTSSTSAGPGAACPPTASTPRRRRSATRHDVRACARARVCFRAYVFDT